MATTPGSAGAAAVSVAPVTQTARQNERAPWLLGSYYRGFGVVSGRLAGRVGTELGVTVGTQGFAFMLGGLPKNRLVSLGVEAPRFSGLLLAQGSAKLALLWPSVETHVITDLGNNLHINVGTALCGLSYTRPFGSAGRAFFLQLRAPMVVLWVPLVVNGLGLGKTERSPDDPSYAERAGPFLSIGAGLEIGIAL